MYIIIDLLSTTMDHVCISIGDIMIYLKAYYVSDITTMYKLMCFQELCRFNLSNIAFLLSLIIGNRTFYHVEVTLIVLCKFSQAFS